jgi:hypothetical protein
MARPNPVPSIVVFFSSNLSNFVNNLLIDSFLIPRPLSSTEIINRHVSPLMIEFTSKSIYPESVYFMELVKRFNVICFILHNHHTS